MICSNESRNFAWAAEEGLYVNPRDDLCRMSGSGLPLMINLTLFDLKFDESPEMNMHSSFWSNQNSSVVGCTDEGCILLLL